MTFNLTSADTVTNAFYLNGGASSTLTNNVYQLILQNGSSAATTASGSVTGYVDIYSGSKLTAGADLSLTGSLNVEDSGSTLNMQGHALTADTLFVGWNGSTAVTVSDLGKVTLNFLYVGNGTVGSDLTLRGGDVVNDLIQLHGGSVLTVDQTGAIGLTLNGTTLGSLTIDPSSIDLVYSATAPNNWDFRWKDPSSGNWVNTLTTMIDDHQINLTLLPGQTYSVQDSGGYTYIYGVGGASVPEPSTLVLACLAIAGLTSAKTWRRRTSR
jgi:T5SS/PEP-CTERM-associated repeat protein